MRNFKIKKLIILFAILSIPVFAFAGCATSGGRFTTYPAGYISPGTVLSDVVDNGTFSALPSYSKNIFIEGGCFYNGNVSVYARADNASGVKLRWADNLNFALNGADCNFAPKRKADIRLRADVVYYGNDVYPYTKSGALANGFGEPVKNYKIKQRGYAGPFERKNQNRGKLIVVDVRVYGQNSGYQDARLAINAYSRGLSPKAFKSLFVEAAACDIAKTVGDATHDPECVQNPY